MGQKEPCQVCNGTRILNQNGVLKIYLYPFKISIICMLIGVILSFIYGYWLLLITLFAFLLPLANGDLRLMLYPYVAISLLLGKRPNCPKCEKGCSIFRID
jgi:hypothetical protein